MNKDASVSLGFAAILGIIVEILHYMLRGDQGFGQTISGAWIIFGAWLPLAVIMLNFIVSNIDKKSYKEMIKKDLLAIIDNILCWARVTFIATAYLFLYDVLGNEKIHTWYHRAFSIGASAVGAWSVFYLWRIAVQIHKLAEVIIKKQPDEN